MSELPAPITYKTALEALDYIPQLYVQQYLIDLDPRAARDRLRMRYPDWKRVRSCQKESVCKCGQYRSEHFFSIETREWQDCPTSGCAKFQRDHIEPRHDCVHCAVEACIQLAIHERNHRVQVTADDVLRLIIEEIAALRGADLRDLYDDDGRLLPVADWPDEWRKGLVEGIEHEDLMDRSHDGVQAGESKAWDKVGTVTKVKLASRKKLLMQAIELLGRHTGVNAFPTPRAGDTTNIFVVTAERAREVAAAKKRLAQVIDVKVDQC